MSATVEATRCRRCGSEFESRLLTEFAGIKVWERRYCVPCTEARIQDEDEWDSTRQQARSIAVASVAIGPKALRETLERNISFDANLAVRFTEAYELDPIKVTQLVTDLAAAIDNGEIDRPAGALQYRLTQLRL